MGSNALFSMCYPPRHFQTLEFWGTILVKSIWYTLKICFVFIIAACSIIKAALFPNLALPPPPSYNVASSGTLWAHWPNIVRGEGGRNGEIVKKCTKCTITFDQDCSLHVPPRKSCSTWVDLPDEEVPVLLLTSGLTATSMWLPMHDKSCAIVHVQLCFEKSNKSMVHKNRTYAGSVWKWS